jgi:hypothetical protein
MTDLYLTSLNFSTEILFLHFINNIIIRSCRSYNSLRTKVPVAQETFTLSFSFVLVIVSTYGDNYTVRIIIRRMAADHASRQYRACRGAIEHKYVQRSGINVITKTKLRILIDLRTGQLTLKEQYLEPVALTECIV